VAIGGSDIYRPVASAAYSGGSAFFEGLVSADFVTEIVPLSFRRDNLVTELVIQAFGREVSFFLGYPLLQPHVGRDDKLGHTISL
jgi:hypothetical protein